jgi:hypothetical protein
VSRYSIRRARAGDFPRLKAFFRLAYGERTILQDERFLLWFFGGKAAAEQAVAERDLNAFIALDENGSIAAHYGFLPAPFSYFGQDYTLVWGVSAFTLPAHRQAGLGKTLVEAVREISDFFGVIGFSEQTADFYDKSGFNVFGLNRFGRHVLILDTRFREVTDSARVAADPLVRSLRPVQPPRKHPPTLLDGLNAWDGALPETLRGVFTRRRDPGWLAWRFSDASSLGYEVRTVGSALGHGLIAYRSISLAPTPYRITKIVELYGGKKAVGALLDVVSTEAHRAGHLYVQFDSFGPCYKAVLEKLGFVALSAETSPIFPSLHNPVGFRPNREYVGLFSRNNPAIAAQLNAGNVYLTQADSDRDRRASI